jgi:putative restriction endonuclease
MAKVSCKGCPNRRRCNAPTAQLRLNIPAVPGDLDGSARVAAFAFLSEQAKLRGDHVMPRTILTQGFQLGGRRVPLMGPQGIFKPAVCSLPLSITTVPAVAGRPRPYDDEYGYEGVRYHYREHGGPNHPDNVGLRRAMVDRVPLVYFHGHRPGIYHAEWPIYVVADDPMEMVFTVLTEEPALPEQTTVADAPRRAYLARMMTTRIHQSRFRDMVLEAYRETCAVCLLRHSELLDAAHILPDTHPLGEPIVPNGLAMCKLHHAAFDADILGVRPDMVIEVRDDVLREIDGPMLIHGLQGFDGQRLILPKRTEQRPNVEFVAQRYELFRQAG